MEDYIIYEGQKIVYTINKGKRRNIYINILNGKIEVKTPKIISKFLIKTIIKKNAESILKRLKEQKERINIYANGKKIKILGKNYKINIIKNNNKRSKYEIVEKSLNIYLNKDVKNEEEQIENIINKMYREIAKKEADKLMPTLTKKVGLYPEKYTIKKVKTIWGSCSSKKNISLNLELAKYDEKAMEYVIIHELCHLKYMNHSKNFWNLVSKNMPDYKEAEKLLKK